MKNFALPPCRFTFDKKKIVITKGALFIRCPLGGRSGIRGDPAAHAHSAYYYFKHIVLLQSPVVQCIVYANSVAAVDACFVKEYSVAVHAHSAPSGHLLERGQHTIS
jgi:hypothetical protein